MFGISFTEVAVVLIVATFVLGIPDIKKAAKFIKPFLRKTMRIRNELQQIVSGIRKDLEATEDGAESDLTSTKSNAQSNNYVIDADNKLRKVCSAKAVRTAPHKPRQSQGRSKKQSGN